MLVLDGEVAVFDHALISRFEWLRHAAPPELVTPPIFMAFDCLYVRGQDLRGPLFVRRNVLEDVLERGYEGLVAKDQQSPYRAGRTLPWLKVKQQPSYRVEERGWDRRQ